MDVVAIGAAIGALSPSAFIMVAFAGMLWWFLTKYIPQMQLQFKDTLDTIVASYKETIGSLNIRLERIEEHITKTNK